MKNLDVTIIILSYNTKEITEKCLEKVIIAKAYCEKILDNKIETIVVEQNSRDGSGKMIKESFPWVKLIRNKKNLGFGGGNNLAMEKANTPYILLINSDLYLQKETLYKALKKMGERKDIDILQVGFRYEDGSFQPCGGYLPNRINTILRLFELDRFTFLKKFIRPIPVVDKRFYDREQKLGWASGAFMLLRREVYEKTNGFDEEIFMYGEDVEWCKRIGDAGFNIIYTPDIKVIHLSGKSIKGREIDTYRKHLEGYLYYHKKHFSETATLIAFLIKVNLIFRAASFALIDREKSRGYLEILSKLDK